MLDVEAACYMSHNKMDPNAALRRPRSGAKRLLRKSKSNDMGNLQEPMVAANMWYFSLFALTLIFNICFYKN